MDNLIVNNMSTFNFNFTQGNFTDDRVNRTASCTFPPMRDISMYLYVELVYLMAIFLIGAPGNLLIIIVQAKNPRKSTTDYLVMIMAMYEFMCITIPAPLSALRNQKLLWPYVGNTVLCNFHTFLEKFTLLGSGFQLTAIALDRYIQTCMPLNQFYNVNVAKRACVVIFVMSLLLGAPYTTQFFWNDSCKLCLKIEPVIITTGRNMGLVVSALSAINFFTMFFCYLGISLSLRKRHNKKVVARNKKIQRIGGSRMEHNDTGIDERDAGFSDINDGTPDTTVSTINCDSTAEPTTQNGNGMDTSSLPVTMVENEVKSDASLKQIKQPIKKSDADKLLSTEGKNLNRLTFILFLITLVYMGTYIINWLLHILGPDTFGLGFFVISFSIPLINCTTNAVMFFAMSSRFRANAKKVICGR